MEKWLCWGSLGVSGTLLIVFLIDIILGIPFNLGGDRYVVDSLGLVACGLAGYLAWESFKELR